MRERILNTTSYGIFYWVCSCHQLLFRTWSLEEGKKHIQALLLSFYKAFFFQFLLVKFIHICTAYVTDLSVFFLCFSSNVNAWSHGQDNRWAARFFKSIAFFPYQLHEVYEFNSFFPILLFHDYPFDTLFHHIQLNWFL